MLSDLPLFTISKLFEMEMEPIERCAQQQFVLLSLSAITIITIATMIFLLLLLNRQTDRH
mgnify:CR=1 FL=1